MRIQGSNFMESSVPKIFAPIHIKNLPEKPQDKGLPLSPTTIKSLAVIGPNADDGDVMLENYNGKPCEYVKPLQALTAVVTTVYQPGCANVTAVVTTIDAAKKVGAAADAVVMVMGTDLTIETENLDRVNITLPGQQQMLISEVANASRGPVILVIMSGGGMDVQFAKDNPKVTSILWVGFPGEKGGAALADVIFFSYNRALGHVIVLCIESNEGKFLTYNRVEGYL
ncbi:hypothetical protein Leryth_015034 [Lithospermum erythrorhizon]|nr:hypothetical protein Leryth_015034 [Lithospermum erythrorhizon]